MKKNRTALIVGIILVLMLIICAFLYLALSKPNYPKQVVNNPITGSTENLVIGEEHLLYVLSELGAYNLHNPPASGDTPKIEVLVDSDKFNAEVQGGKLSVQKGESSSPDIRISTTRSEVISAISSGNVKEYMKSSVNSKKTNVELVEGYSRLFFKGYLTLYQEMTGKSMTGSVIRIFSQG